MKWQECILAGGAGSRLRKAMTATALAACADAAAFLLRDPRWDGWWDAYTWPQLFLIAPMVFYLCAAGWNFLCLLLIVIRSFAWKPTKADASTRAERDVRFWAWDSLRLAGSYIAAGVLGDIPMWITFTAEIRKWPSLHWAWYNASEASLLLTIGIWAILDWWFRRGRFLSRRVLKLE